MSDNKKWVKSWTSLLTDPSFQDMRIEDKGRWFTILLLLGEQGKNGVLRIYPPASLICLLLGISTYDAILALVTPLKNVGVTIALQEDGSLIISMQNWRKYQVDSSLERVRRFRAKCNDVEEIRREEKRATAVSSTSKPELKGPYGG